MDSYATLTDAELLRQGEEQTALLFALEKAAKSLSQYPNATAHVLSEIFDVYDRLNQLEKESLKREAALQKEPIHEESF